MSETKWDAGGDVFWVSLPSGCFAQGRCRCGMFRFCLLVQASTSTGSTYSFPENKDWPGSHDVHGVARGCTERGPQGDQASCPQQFAPEVVRPDSKAPPHGWSKGQNVGKVQKMSEATWSLMARPSRFTQLKRSFSSLARRSTREAHYKVVQGVAVAEGRVPRAKLCVDARWCALSH